jgi:hypothetical protein
MENIKFNYLFRDAGDNKAHGSAVFSNPEKLNIEVIELNLRDSLIDGELFDPEDLGIPRLSLTDAPFIQGVDQPWNEFTFVELTDEQPTDNRSIVEFLSSCTAVRN